MQKSKFLQFFIPACTSLILVLIWFHSGKILATGESGLPFYNTSGLAEYTRTTWSKGAIGLPTGAAIASYPFLHSIAFLQAYGLSPVLLQAIFFFLCLLTSQFSIVFLIKNLIPEISSRLLGTVVPALFYISNLYALVNIWNRFQYTFIMLYTLLPLALLLFSLAIRKKNILYAIILNFILLLFCMPLSSIPLILILWLVLGLYTLFEIYANRKNKKFIFFCIAMLGLQFLLWVISSLWWVLPFLTTLKNSPYVSTEAYSETGNLNTFIEISKRLGNMSYILRMMHGSFFSDIGDVWKNLTHNFVYQILSYITPVLVFSTLFIKHKPKYIYFFIGLSLSTLFLMKGAAPPFGFLFGLLFEKVRLLEAFRNPFEKLGMILPLGYTPLIGYSLVTLSNKFPLPLDLKRIYKKSLLVPASCLMLLAVLPFPLWNSWVFTSTTSPQNDRNIGYKIEVPDYYQQTNTYLNQNTGEARNVAMPFDGEGITYEWQYGYAGVDLYNGLFNTPFISFSTAIQFYKPIADNIENIFTTYPQKFSAVMQIMNAKHVVIRNDVDYESRQLTAPDQLTEEIKKENRGLKKVQTFGKLDIYEQDKDLFLAKIYTAQNIIQYPNKQSNALGKVVPFVEYQKADILVRDEEIPSEFQYRVKEKLFQTTVNDTIRKVTREATIPLVDPHVAKENALVELPYITKLPDAPIYPLLRLREDIDDWLNRGRDQDNQFNSLKRAGKRLVEIYRSTEQGKSTQVLESVAKEYKKKMDRITQPYIYSSEGVQQELMRHKIVIEDLLQRYPDTQNIADVMEVKKKLDKYFSEGVFIKVEDNAEYKDKFYTLEVPRDGTYVLTTQKLPLKNERVDYYMSNSMSINDAEYKLSEQDKNIITVNLVKGENKIIFDEDKVRGLYKQPIRDRIMYAKQAVPQEHTISNPQIVFSKKTDAQWAVSVTNATEPYILVFSEAFHPLWQAKIDGKPLSDANHFMVNGYANAWKITQPGNYSIELYFKAQESFTVGSLISKIVILVTGIVAIFWVVKNIVRKT